MFIGNPSFQQSSTILMILNQIEGKVTLFAFPSKGSSNPSIETRSTMFRVTRCLGAWQQACIFPFAAVPFREKKWVPGIVSPQGNRTVTSARIALLVFVSTI